MGRDISVIKRKSPAGAGDSVCRKTSEGRGGMEGKPSGFPSPFQIKAARRAAKIEKRRKADFPIFSAWRKIPTEGRFFRQAESPAGAGDFFISMIFQAACFASCNRQGKGLSMSDMVCLMLSPFF